MLRDRRKRLAVLAAAVTLICYLAPWRSDRGGGDTAPAELLPIAILDGHGFYLDQFRGATTDLPYSLRARNGRVLSVFPILPGVLNVPVFAAARAAGIELYSHRKRLAWLTAVALTAASSVFLFLFLCRIGIADRRAFFWTLLYSLGTCAWSVASTSMNQHGPSLFFLTLALYLLTHDPPAALVASGAALGFAVMGRPANIALVVPIGLFAAVRARRRSPALVAGAAIPAALLFWYSTTYWGTWKALGQGQGTFLFHGSIARGLLGLLVSPSHGLFVFTPVFVLATLEFPDAIRRGGIDRAMVAGLLLSLLVYARWSMWWGGESFGYRLLSEQAPFLTALAATFAERYRSRGWMTACALLAGWSVAVHGLGAFLYPSGFDAGIDYRASRLWSFPDTEIARLARIAAARLGIGGVPVRQEPPSELSPDAATWWSPALNDDTIPGFPDSPNDGEVVHGTLRIDGWARSTTGDVEVQALLDGGEQIIPTARTPRPDVGRVLPRLGDVSHAGFRAWVAPPAGPPREHTILFEMRAPNGKVKRLGPIRFTWSQ